MPAVTRAGSADRENRAVSVPEPGVPQARAGAAGVAREVELEFRTRRLARILSGQAGTSAARSVVTTFISPLLARTLGAGPAATGLALSLALASAVVVPPLVGAWSDASRSGRGRRTPFVLGFSVLAALGLVLLAFAPSFPVAAAAAALTFVGVVGSQTPYQVLVPDLLPAHRLERGYAVSSLVAAVGAGVGLVLGGVLFDVAPAAPFLAVAALVAGTLAWAFAGFREPQARAHAAVELEGLAPGALGWLTHHRPLLMFLVGQTVWWVALGAFPPFAIQYLGSVLGLSSSAGTLIVAVVGGVGLAAGLSFGALSLDAAGRRLAVTGGLVLVVLGLAGAFLAGPDRLLALAGLLAFALGSSVFQVVPYAMVVGLAPPERVGAFSGVSTMSKAVGMAVAPSLAGLAVEAGGGDFRYALLLAAAAALASLAPLWAMGRLGGRS